MNKKDLTFCVVFLAITLALTISGAFDRPVEAQVPDDIPRCHKHVNAFDIVECRMPGGITCYFRETVSGIAMDCME